MNSATRATGPLHGGAAAALLVIAALFGFLPIEASAQSASNGMRIGILSSGDLSNRSTLDKALVETLNAQGYVEGRNLVIERRYGSAELRNNAAELAGMKLDAILTSCTVSTLTMKGASASTPIVMAAVSDPVRQHIIASLARPGENVTGTSSQAEDLLGKRLEQLHEVVPGVSTVAVLLNANNPVHALGKLRLDDVAKRLNLKLIELSLPRGDELPAAMDVAVRARAGALLVMPDDPMMFNLRPRIVALAAKNRIADFYWAREFVESGGLMSYGESLGESYREAAKYIARIKLGADPATMPVRQPTRFEMVVNQKTARALGLAIPQSVLLRADEVIQ